MPRYRNRGDFSGGKFVAASTQEVFRNEEEPNLSPRADPEGTSPGWQQQGQKTAMAAAGVSANNPSFLDEFMSATRQRESGGRYDATNPSSSATGAYQFLWGTWGDDIRRVTGIGDRQTFMANPAAQDAYMKYYTQKHLMPHLNELRSVNGQGLADSDLLALAHFRGTAGAKEMLRSNSMNSQKEAFNATGNDYIASGYRRRARPTKMSLGGTVGKKPGIVDWMGENPDLTGTIASAAGGLVQSVAGDSVGGSALSGALSGAGAGASFGAPGMAVGAVVGGVTSLVKAQEEKRLKEQMLARLAQRRRTAATENTAATLSEMGFAVGGELPEVNPLKPKPIAPIDTMTDLLYRSEQSGAFVSAAQRKLNDFAANPVVPAATPASPVVSGDAHNAEIINRVAKGLSWDVNRKGEYRTAVGSALHTLFGRKKTDAHLETEMANTLAWQHQQAGNPTIKTRHEAGDVEGIAADRAFYRPGENTMYLASAEDFHAELAHAQQNKRGEQYAIPENITRLMNSSDARERMLGRKAYDAHMYETKGTVEYDAHKIKEPLLREQTTRRYQTKVANAVSGALRPLFGKGGSMAGNYNVEGGEVIEGHGVKLARRPRRVASNLVRVQGPKHGSGGVNGQGGERVFSDRLAVDDDLLALIGELV